MTGNSSDIPSINRPNENDQCEEIVINTHLASPRAAVLEELNIGDLLAIIVETDQGPIQAITTNGDVSGTVVTRDQIRLLTCINSGVEFEAEVLAVDNGMCQVQIRAL